MTDDNGAVVWMANVIANVISSVEDEVRPGLRALDGIRCPAVITAVQGQRLDGVVADVPLVDLGLKAIFNLVAADHVRARFLRAL